MAKSNQKITIVVHTPADTKEIFSSSQVNEFWMEKIIAAVQECRGNNSGVLIMNLISRQNKDEIKDADLDY